ncbi:MAG TPA: four helix bundle protein [Bacteroidales bacterium]|nr:four helix bundle protein [Bacteroidales bacterium]
MKLEELQVYQLSMEIGERVWEIVIKWDFFSKDTIGKQLVRSVDSIAANLSEGFGRYHYNESKHFYYYSRGSLYETKTWLTKAKSRQLITENEFNTLINNINIIGIKLNNYINSIGKKSNHSLSINDIETNDN